MYIFKKIFTFARKTAVPKSGFFAAGRKPPAFPAVAAELILPAFPAAGRFLR